VLTEERAPIRRQPDQDIAALAVLADRKSAIDSVFPHRQTRARGSPRLDHVGIGSRLSRDPFQEIENQGIQRFVGRHRILRIIKAALLRS
jgi:hypothetical protein